MSKYIAVIILIILCITGNVYAQDKVTKDNVIEDLPWLKAQKALVEFTFTDNAQEQEFNETSLQNIVSFLDESATNRVQIVSYADAEDDLSSKARQISLKRALNLRNKLINRGISKERVIVRAMGNKTAGDKNRIAVFKL